MTSTPTDLRPLAHFVGPFAAPAFLDVVHAHFPRGPLVEGVAPDGWVRLEEVDGVAVGVGHRDLVDYRSPLGVGGATALVNAVGDAGLELDSIPEATAVVLAEAFRAAGRSATVETDDLAAVLELPPTFDDWLAVIGKKERHETRRKRRRYEEALGPARIEEADGVDRLDEFVTLHRSSPGDKGAFMTTAMVDFFGDLLSLDGWSIRFLVDPSGRMVAGGVGACDEDGFYLYNAAFDHAHGDASPGVVLTAALIEDCIERGLARFDFLKGDEAYKFRLGASERPLATVRVDR